MMRKINEIKSEAPASDRFGRFAAGASFWLGSKMAFLIQNTQNRDARAINLKLDELIRAIDKARDQMMNIEKLSDVELDTLEAQFERIRAAGARRAQRQA